MMDDAVDNHIAEKWAARCDRYHATRRQEVALAWLKHHQGMLRSHKTPSAILCAHHEAEIRKYERMLGIDESKGVA